MKVLIATGLIAWLVADGVGDFVDGIIHTITDPIGRVVRMLPFFDDEAETPEAPPAPKQQVIGTVRFTYESFALIYTPTGSSVPAGTMATTLDQDGRSTGVEMRMSAERKNSFLVADILRGSPKAGQFVVVKPRLQPGASQYQVLE